MRKLQRPGTGYGSQYGARDIRFLSRDDVAGDLQLPQSPAICPVCRAITHV